MTQYAVGKRRKIMAGYARKSGLAPADQRRRQDHFLFIRARVGWDQLLWVIDGTSGSGNGPGFLASACPGDFGQLQNLGNGIIPFPLWLMPCRYLFTGVHRPASHQDIVALVVEPIRTFLQPAPRQFTVARCRKIRQDLMLIFCNQRIHFPISYRLLLDSV
ncbi:hypothetical protein [Zavarzinella formosa]|uniref:hypothetical protein n=1 Tax=Zavarzinella formosa TaxID=360055 RepID=UPI000369BA98|nr:hypothetical protein [Zavarzinella formosa]